MLLIIGLYFTALTYLCNKVIKMFNQFERENINNILNINNSDLYKKFKLFCKNKNIINKQPVLVCCTGDKQSMALLTLAIAVYGSDNVHVLTIDHHFNSNIFQFMKNICNTNNLIFYTNKLDNMRETREDVINSICKKYDNMIVFEAHTIENNTNIILNNIIMNQNIDLYYNTNIYYPFINTYII